MEISRNFRFLTFLALVLCCYIQNVNSQGPVSLIRSLLQNNLVGAPVVHQHTQWDFDPDVGIKRRPQYYELNGYRASKLIERIGLGIDGNEEYRLQQQKARDAGRLNDFPVIQYVI